MLGKIVFLFLYIFLRNAKVNFLCLLKVLSTRKKKMHLNMYITSMTDITKTPSYSMHRQTIVDNDIAKNKHTYLVFISFNEITLINKFV